MPIFKVNDEVMTPNGPGVVESPVKEAGQIQLLVRHQITKMIGNKAGICWTPNAHLSALYQYPQELLSSISIPARSGRFSGQAGRQQLHGLGEAIE
jgi:hypothetical protein